jgi:transposase
LLVYSQEAYKREILALRKKFREASEKEYAGFVKLSKEAFNCPNDAQRGYDLFLKKCKYLTITDLNLEKVAFFDKKGRPKKEETPAGYHYFIRATAYCERDTFQKMAQTKGKFILATNEVQENQLTPQQFFENYKGQSTVERGFRFLKDPQFMAATFFVKKPERLEALLFIMTLCLSVYAAIEYRIRQKLKEKERTLPNQLRKEVQNPTAKWIFACFSSIHVLYVNQIPQILNLNDFHRKVISLLGENYNKYYLLI